MFRYVACFFLELPEFLKCALRVGFFFTPSSPLSLLRFTHTFCSPSPSLSHSLLSPGATDSSPLLTLSGFASAICGAKCSLQPSESPWSLLYIPWLIAAIEKWKPNLGKDLDVIEKKGFTLARTAVNRKAKLDNFFFFLEVGGWGWGEGQWNSALWFKERERTKLIPLTVFRKCFQTFGKVIYYNV